MCWSSLWSRSGPPLITVVASPYDGIGAFVHCGEQCLSPLLISTTEVPSGTCNSSHVFPPSVVSTTAPTPETMTWLVSAGSSAPTLP